MSKMSELHAELTEQANELGFASIEEAEQAGYGVDLTEGKILEPEEAAHRALLGEKKYIIGGLKFVLDGGYEFSSEDRKDIEAAIKFIEENVK